MNCQVFLSRRLLKVAKGFVGSHARIPTSCRKFSSSNAFFKKMSLKEKMLNSIRDIRSSNNGYHLGDLLLEANLNSEHRKRSCKHSDFDVVAKMLTELKSGRVLPVGSYILLFVSKHLEASRLLPFLLEIENTESLNLELKNSEEDSFVKALEVYHRRLMKSVDRSLRHFKILRTYELHSEQIKLNELQDLITEIASKHSILLEEDRVEHLLTVVAEPPFDGDSFFRKDCGAAEVNKREMHKRWKKFLEEENEQDSECEEVDPLGKEVS